MIFRRAAAAEGRAIPPSFGTSASPVSQMWQSWLALWDLFLHVLNGNWVNLFGIDPEGCRNGVSQLATGQLVVSIVSGWGCAG